MKGELLKFLKLPIEKRLAVISNAINKAVAASQSKVGDKR